MRLRYGHVEIGEWEEGDRVSNAADHVSPRDSGAVVEDYLDFPGGRVHVLRGGTGDPVLFLHGAGGAGRWHEFQRRLARNFTVYAPDHPGFGGSDELAEVEDMDDLVYHYLDVIDRLGLDRPRVVGASFGGWLAAELAVLAPHAVGDLVLLAPPGLRLPDHPIADMFRMTPAERVHAIFHDTSRASVLVPSTPDIDAVVAAYRDMTALARFAWSPFFNNPKLERRLHRVTARTRVLWGAEDQLIPIEHGHRYAKLVPQAELVVLADCGHVIAFERPAEAARIVTEFFGVAR
jgi:pimeloyl-ACP methyl ester carboxylesterase